MEFIDLKTQYKIIEESVNVRINTVLQHGQYIMGPEVSELEEKLSDYTNSKYCIAVSSGTDALFIAMMALGIKSGDEVITTPFTFVSTGEMICLLGTKPVFVDIDPDTYNILPEAIEEVITPKTKLIIAVSLYGQCADFDEINNIADKHGIPVIEDAAQSFGATYKGQQSCSLTTIACTSFYPSKPLGCYGDAGACFTNDERLAKSMKEIRIHGQDRHFHYSQLGINGRMDTIQAAILLEKLKLFPEEVSKRANIGLRYSEEINALSITVKTPLIKEGNSSVYAQYTIAVENRDELKKELMENDIPTTIHYPTPLHKQPVFKSFINQRNNLINTNLAASKVLGLPMHPYLSVEQQDTIINTLGSVIVQ